MKTLTIEQDLTKQNLDEIVEGFSDLKFEGLRLWDDLHFFPGWQARLFLLWSALSGKFRITIKLRYIRSEVEAMLDEREENAK